MFIYVVPTTQDPPPPTAATRSGSHQQPSDPTAATQDPPPPTVTTPSGSQQPPDPTAAVPVGKATIQMVVQSKRMFRHFLGFWLGHLPDISEWPVIKPEMLQFWLRTKTKPRKKPHR